MLDHPALRLWQSLTTRFPAIASLSARAAAAAERMQALYKSIRQSAPVTVLLRLHATYKQAQDRRAEARRLAEEQRQREIEEQRAQDEARLAEEARLEALKPRDTEGAVEDMRLAHSYLEDWAADKGHHVLAFAAKYIEEARAKDRDAKLTVEIKSGPDAGETIAYSQDELAGMALFYESQAYNIRDAEANDLVKAAELLERAIAYDPASIQYRRHLADVHLNLHDKSAALAVAEQALAVNPKSLEARKLNDYVETAPVTRPPSPVSGSGIFTALMVGLMLFGIIALFSGNFSAAFGLWVVAAILGWFGRMAMSHELIVKAMDEQARDRADGR